MIPKQGESAEILIGCEWFACTVLSVVDTPHWSGQVIKCFTVQFPEGATLACGVNSIRKRQ
jgi:hypothetical protein